MPVEGMNRKIYRTRKFGSWERSVAMDAEFGRHDVLAEIATEVGLPPGEAWAFLDSDAGQKK
jgi:hypothetical protein